MCMWLCSMTNDRLNLRKPPLKAKLGDCHQPGHMAVTPAPATLTMGDACHPGISGGQFFDSHYGAATRACTRVIMSPAGRVYIDTMVLLGTSALPGVIGGSVRFEHPAWCHRWFC